MRDLRPLFPIYAAIKAGCCSASLMIIVSTALSLIQPYLLGRAIDALDHNRPQSEVSLAGAILGLAVVLGGRDLLHALYDHRRVAHDRV